MKSRPAAYRLVHFVPDPVLGGRVPVAALVREGTSLAVTRAPHLPGPACLGGVNVAASLHLVLEDLQDAVSFDRLPASLGPHVVLGDAIDVPVGVKDCTRWVENLLSRNNAHGPVRDEKQPRAPSRLAFGFRFLQNYRVDRYVKKRFQPTHDLGGRLKAASSLDSISQWVPGASEVLLMEPLAPSRPSWESDVKTVAQRFGAYQTAVRGLHLELQPQFVAYVLNGGSQPTRDEILRRLRPFSDSVIDTDASLATSEFIDRIRKLGESVELTH